MEKLTREQERGICKLLHHTHNEEMTFNFLATINNTLNKDMELKKDSERDEPETISEIVPHPLKFNVKTQPCVLTNQGIVTEVIKFN